MSRFLLWIGSAAIASALTLAACGGGDAQPVHADDADADTYTDSHSRGDDHYHHLERCVAAKPHGASGHSRDLRQQ